MLGWTKNVLALAQHLGIRSIRSMTQLLMKWQAALKTTEIDLLVEYFAGPCYSNPKDSFPCLFLSVNVEGITSPFIESVASLCKDFFSSTGKFFLPVFWQILYFGF